MTISVIELPDDREGGGSSKQEEEVDECNSKLVLSFTKAHTVYEIVKFYFYMWRVSKWGWQNFLNFELMWFFVKCEVLTERQAVTDLFG